MQLRDKNPATRALIQTLVSQGVKVPAWRAIADALNRPTRQHIEVPLARLETVEGKLLVVPGTVLGNGVLTKKCVVAALRFTGGARQSIEKAGGSCLSIAEAVEKHGDGKGVRIVG